MGEPRFRIDFGSGHQTDAVAITPDGTVLILDQIMPTYGVSNFRVVWLPSDREKRLEAELRKVMDAPGVIYREDNTLCILLPSSTVERIKALLAEEKP